MDKPHVKALRNVLDNWLADKPLDAPAPASEMAMERALRNDLRNEQTKREQAEERIKNLTKELDGVRSWGAKAAGQRVAAESCRNDLAARLADMVRHRDDLANRLKDEQANAAQRETEILGLKSRRDFLVKENEALRKRADSNNELAMERLQKIASLEREIERLAVRAKRNAELEARVDADAKKKVELSNRIQELTTSVSVLTEQLDAAKRDAATAGDGRDYFFKEVERLKTDLATAEARAAKWSEDIIAMRNENAGLNARLAEKGPVPTVEELNQMRRQRDAARADAAHFQQSSDFYQGKVQQLEAHAAEPAKLTRADIDILAALAHDGNAAERFEATNKLKEEAIRRNLIKG